MDRTTLDHFRVYQRVLDAVQGAVEQHVPNEFSGTSEMWEKLFSRRNAGRSFDSFFRMLDHRNDLALGIANLSEERFFADYVNLYSALMDPSDLRRIAPGLTGCPSLLQIHGLPANIAVMQNETRIRQLFEQIGEPPRPLRVLEVGAGYGGMANLLLKRGVVSSYTIIDLPDNLAQSAYFLTLENPEYSPHYCETRELQQDRQINFFTPNEIEKLSGSQYDLVLNCDSLGEMPASVAQSYVGFIFEHLAPAGVFYSKNGVQRNTNTVECLTDYGFARFELQAVMATPLSTGLMDDHSTVLFLAPGPPKREVDWPGLNLLSKIYKFGLSIEVEGLASQLSNPPTIDGHRRFLIAAEELFSDPPVAAYVDHDFEDDQLNAAYQYLLGMHQYVFGSQEEALERLADYLTHSQSPAAEGQARVLLSSTNKDVLQDERLGSEVTRFFINTIRLPIKDDETAHAKFLRAVERRVRNRFLGQL